MSNATCMRTFPGTIEAFIVVVLTVGCACECMSTLAKCMHVLNIKCVCRCISVEEAGVPTGEGEKM